VEVTTHWSSQVIHPFLSCFQSHPVVSVSAPLANSVSGNAGWTCCPDILRDPPIILSRIVWNTDCLHWMIVSWPRQSKSFPGSSNFLFHCQWPSRNMSQQIILEAKTWLLWLTHVKYRRERPGVTPLCDILNCSSILSFPSVAANKHPAQTNLL